MTARIAVSIALIAAAFASCAVMPPAASQPPPSGARPPVPGEELRDATFRELPPGSREYLASIAEAVAAGNTPFLLAQGERGYSARIRPGVDPGSYAALLYRVGAYAGDSPAGSETAPRVDLGGAKSLRFTGWEEEGPILAVRGRLEFKDGSAQPCALYVLWKLEPPRILGREP